VPCLHCGEVPIGSDIPTGARSCLSQQIQPGGTCPRVQRVFGYVRILEIARQCCVQVCGVVLLCRSSGMHAPCLVLCKSSYACHFHFVFGWLDGFLGLCCVAATLGGAPHVNETGLNAWL